MDSAESSRPYIMMLMSSRWDARKPSPCTTQLLSGAASHMVHIAGGICARPDLAQQCGARERVVCRHVVEGEGLQLVVFSPGKFPLRCREGIAYACDWRTPALTNTA